MKKLGFTLFAAAVLVLPLCAQVTTVQADVPFDFVVGKTTIPAGKYFISSQYEPLAVQFANGGYGRTFLCDSQDSHYNRPQQPVMVFHHYGNQYFLSKIEYTWTSREFPMTPVERELEKKGSAAARQPRAEIVLAMR